MSRPEGRGLQGCAERSILVSNDMSMRIVDKGETLRLLNEQSRGPSFTRLQAFSSKLYKYAIYIHRPKISLTAALATS